jgi:hypothetical protein
VDADSVPRTTASPRSPATASVAGELRRIQERWRVLPLDRATGYSGRVRTLVQQLADDLALSGGARTEPVPDLGPATLMDQLAVVVYDAGEAGRSDGLAVELAALRRLIS